MTVRPLEPLGLAEAGARIGAYCALERGLFELTGAAAVAEGPPEAAGLLAAASGEHAWHAELWADRLPVTAAIDARALIVLPEPADRLFELLAASTPLARLAGLFRVVVPRLLVTYAAHEQVTAVASDGPLRRALRLVMRDETEEWVAGEALLEGILGDQAALEEVSATVRELEGVLVGHRRGPGLLPWPGGGGA